MSDVQALLLAAEKGDIDAIKNLLLKGVDVNTSDSHGETCLHLSVRNGYESIVKLLCDSGADIFIKNHSVQNALLIAANSIKGTCLVDYLLSRGLRFDSELHEAGFKGDLEKVKRCINELNILVDIRDVCGKTVLCMQ